MGAITLSEVTFSPLLCAILTLFPAGKLLLRDFNCAYAMFLVYNNPGNLNNVLAMHLVPNSFAFKLPRC